MKPGTQHKRRPAKGTRWRWPWQWRWNPLRLTAAGLFAVVFALIGLALFSAWSENRRCADLFARADAWNTRARVYDAGGVGDFNALLAEENALIREGIATGCPLKIQ